MFKSLLQTIPTLSGNFTLACKLNNFTSQGNNEYISYINEAILMPLDNNYNLTKDISINLINSKYEYDINKYYKELSSYFYGDTYLKNTNIFETYSEDKKHDLPDNRDKNFEFGCKRISYNKYQYQYQFYAPIYIDNVDDIPDKFVIEIYNNNVLLKKFNIAIGLKASKNKLRIYLTKFIEKITNNIPIVWQFENNKILYQNVIDCKNGGLINFTSYNTIQNNDVKQTIINDIDNLICQGYKNNGIILSECIPLSFIFNINDIIDISDNYYYHFNNFRISGYYMTNNIKHNFYNFSTNYHNNDLNYSVFNNYQNNFSNVSYNIFDNDNIYSLKEGTNYSLYYQNTFKNTYCQWKLYESDSYIINLNTVFTYNTTDNKFPVFKNSLQYKIQALFDNNALYLPINNYVTLYESDDIQKYNILLNNNYCNWFDIYDEKSIDNYKTTFKLVNHNHTFVNGIKYYIKDNNVRYFNVFINPILKPINNYLILGNIVLEKKQNEEGITYNTYSQENNQYYEPYTEEEINDLNNQAKINNSLYDTEVYIKYNSNMTIKYIEYDNSTILDYLFSSATAVKNNLLSNSTHKLLINNNESIFYTTYKYLFSVNYVDENLIKEYITNIINSCFNPTIGYKKLNIQLKNISKDVLYNIFSNYKEYTNLLYFSLPNEEEKQKLYYVLINNIYSYEYLITNNITLYLKTTFIEIENYDRLVNNLLYNTHSLYNKLKSGYYVEYVNSSNSSIDLQNAEQIVNQFIEYIKLSILDNINKDNILSVYNKLVDSQDYTTNLTNYTFNNDKSLKYNMMMIFYNDFINNSSLTTYKKNIVFNNLLKEILYICYYIELFVCLKNITYDELSQIDIYNYIPYYNDNNLVINYNYYEQVSNKRDYNKLYTNIQLNDYINLNDYTDSSNIIFINITSKELYNDICNSLFDSYNILNTSIEYINEDNENYHLYTDSNLKLNVYNKIKYYHKQYIKYNKSNKHSINDVLNEKYELIDLDKYINDYIADLITQNINITITSNEIQDNKLSNIHKYNLINNSIIFKDQIAYLPIIYNVIENGKLITKNYEIPINLYISGIPIYELSTEIDNYNKMFGSLFIYKETNNIQNNILVDVIYNDVSTNKKDNSSWRQLMKNVNIVSTNDHTNYVYSDEYNYLLKLTYKNYLDNYKTSIPQLYKKCTDINNVNISYNICEKNSECAYLKIDYYFMLSTNSLNIYNIDNNDNFEITTINDKPINEFTLKELFKNIYPYLSQDILLTIIGLLNLKVINEVNIILPNNIKCKINTLVNTKKDNKDFTEIKLANNIIKEVYLNRYFGNIMPYFIICNKYIYNIRSKKYLITNSQNINNIANNDNVIINDINIYQHNLNNNYEQYEYKHFNDNFFINLPIELTFNIYNGDKIIKYITINDLHTYINKNKCFESFKQYVIKNYLYFNIHNISENNLENLLLYVFNKYSIEYIQTTNYTNTINKVYTVQYKLHLL